MMDRRHLLWSGAGCLLCGARADAQPRAAGCAAVGGLPARFSSANFDPAAGSPQTTGDPARDRALGMALGRLAAFYDVRPGFGLYDDAAAPNALAYRESFLPGTRGTIALGRTLLGAQLRANDDAGLAVVAVLAHEFAHILQYETGADAALPAADGTAKLVELNADFFAGLYLAHLQAANPAITLFDSGRLFNALGDTQFGSPDHHGTPEQRVLAIEFGHRVGRRNPDLRPRAAMAESVDYVRNTFG